MALLVLFFFDLATLPQSHGDDALYQKALADHHISGARYNVSLEANECKQVARNSSDLPPFAAAIEQSRQPWRMSHETDTRFSRIGWLGNRAFLQLRTSDATSCLLYQRVGASFRLVREIRLPH